VAARFFVKEFIMTLKKSRRGQAIIKGQAIFEYFILTIAIVAVVLFFASSPYFKNINNSCETVFNQAVGEMLK